MNGLADPESLPKGWATLPLGKIITKLVDGSHNPPSKRESGVPMLSARNILNNQIIFEEYRFISDEDFEREHARTRISPGDVLLTIVGTIGRSAVVPAGAKRFALQRSVAVLTPAGLLPKYLMYQLQAPVLQRYFERNARGTAQKGVYLKTLGQTPILVAPLRQQEIIVAEIEKQFSRLDEAIANLKRVKANLRRYKASVLKAAVEGKLTEDWRLSARAASRKRAQASELETIPKAGNDKWFIYIIECDDGSYYVGHTADLHDRWQRHCEGSGADWTRQHPPKYLVHFEECGRIEAAVKRENDLKTGFGRTWRKREIDGGRMKPLVHNPANETAQPVHGEDMQTGSKLLERILAERRAKWSGRGKYKEPDGPVSENLPFLPKEWTWAVVEQLGVVQLGRQRSPKNRSKDHAVRYIRAANITETGLDLSDLLDMEFLPQEQERYRLRKGDLVLSEASGSPKQVGKPAVWRDQLPLCCFQNTVIRLRPTVDLSPYLLKCFQSYYVNDVFAKIAGGVGINHLSAEKFSKITVPLAPIAEQYQIVAEVERRLSVIDELEAAVEANLTRAERLRQSILSQAFAGKLVGAGAPSSRNVAQDLPVAAEPLAPYGVMR